MKQISRMISTVIIMLVVMCLTACGGNTTFTQRTANYTVKLSFDRLAIGDRTATVEITDQSGQPISANTVTLAPTMLSMGMASPAVRAQPTSGGRYIGEKVLLSMAGEWEVDITIQAVKAIETARFTFTVPTQ